MLRQTTSVNEEGLNVFDVSHWLRVLSGVNSYTTDADHNRWGTCKGDINYAGSPTGRSL